MACEFPNQINNRNFLAPNGFTFTLSKDPKISFFCTKAKIPLISYPPLNQPTYLKSIPLPATTMEYDDLRLTFMIDEDMVNYISLYEWMTGLGFPKTTDQYRNLTQDENDSRINHLREVSDGDLTILNSNYNQNVIVRFKDLFPIELTSVEYDTQISDIQYLSAQATFQYTIYDIIGKDGKIV